MLDLNVFQERYFDIKLVDGRVVNLPKPSQRTMLKIAKLEEDLRKQGNNSSVVLKAMNELVVYLLNTNKEGHEFTLEWVMDTIPVQVVGVIFEKYMEFANDINNDPN